MQDKIYYIADTFGSNYGYRKRGNSDEYLMDVIEVVSYEEGNIIQEKEQYIYNTYFKYGVDKRFAETPIGKIAIKEFNVYE